MRKSILFIGLLSLLGCKDKIFFGSKEFSEKEKTLNLSIEEAKYIYDNNFFMLFKEKLREEDENYYYNIYIYENCYYIGFSSYLDKRDRTTAPIYFLAKIDSDTREITAVKNNN